MPLVYILTHPLYLSHVKKRSKLRGINPKRLKRETDLDTVFFTDGGMQDLSRVSKRLAAFITHEEELIEINASRFTTAEMERINESIIRLKDSAWALEKDIIDNTERLFYLADTDSISDIPRDGFKKYRNINLLLNAIERLEVRGRDSAGIQISMVLNGENGLGTVIEKLSDSHLADEWLSRTASGYLLDGSVQVASVNGADGHATLLTFTYKKAAVTGTLGENGRYLRKRVRNDRILRTIVNMPTELHSYMAHTRWASVGSITEQNCHPVNNYIDSPGAETPSQSVAFSGHYASCGKDGRIINVVLNGDIDNYALLRAELESGGQQLIDGSVTTDTKIIPLQIERYISDGYGLQEAFRRALNDFEGSHAIAMSSNLEPDKVYLALRGSGQSLYIGISNDQLVYSSELYGLVEVTDRFVKMDGETERIPGDSATKGQIFVLSGNAGGAMQGINAVYYDGHDLPLSDNDVHRAEITTRDIDRKDYPHYLLKEISEAPFSVRKTMRGKYHIKYGDDGTVDSVAFNLGRDVMPSGIIDALQARRITEIYVVGQGTAAVAGAAIAEALSQYIQVRNIHIEAKKASELSGFSLRDNMEHALVIAVTQSGTTTDTNRAVALAKERGGSGHSYCQSAAVRHHPCCRRCFLHK